MDTYIVLDFNYMYPNSKYTSIVPVQCNEDILSENKKKYKNENSFIIECYIFDDKK